MFGLVPGNWSVGYDAIVVVENVERILHEEPNIAPKQATIKSMDEITWCCYLILRFVLSAVFIPPGFLRWFYWYYLYRQFSITIVSAMVLSVAIAIILTPGTLRKYSFASRC